MRIKVSKRRGRPRGKHRSPADFRLLEHLALISTEYGIDSEKFFEGFVEAWKRQQSTCESLSIRCRKRTRDYAVFLIIDSCKVVAQFPIPKHILEENSPPKEFAPARASRRTMLGRAKVKDLRIGDLKSGMNRIDLKAGVLEIPKPKSVATRFGGVATATNAIV